MTDICKAIDKEKRKRVRMLLEICDEQRKKGCENCKIGTMIERMKHRKCIDVSFFVDLNDVELARLCKEIKIDAERHEKEEYEKLCERRRKADIIEHYCTNRKANCERCKVGEMIENFTGKKCVNVSAANLADDVLETVSKMRSSTFGGLIRRTALKISRRLYGI